MNIYLAEVRRNGKVSVRLRIEAPHRAKAVHNAQLWFWSTYRGEMGAAHKVLTVSDPYNEVRYDSSFSCHDKRNRHLPDDIIDRVIRESNGELLRDTREGRAHFPPGSVRRVRRRRDAGSFPIPNIRQMRGGLLYYRLIVQGQVSRNGRRYRKRKQRDVRLKSRTLADAIIEIERRGLVLEHEQRTKRLVKVRSIPRMARILERKLKKAASNHLSPVVSPAPDKPTGHTLESGVLTQSPLV